MPPTATMRKRKKEIIPQTSKRGKNIIAESDDKTNKLQVVITPVNGKEILDTSLSGSKINNVVKSITEDAERKEATKNKNIIKTTSDDIPESDQEKLALDFIKSFTATPGLINEPESEISTLTSEDVRPNVTHSRAGFSLPHSLIQNKLEVPNLLTTTNDVSQAWTTMQPSTIYDHEQTLRLLEGHVKSVIFHRIVFISSPAVIAYTKDPFSLCQIMCNYLNIPSAEQDRFWMIYSKAVERALN
jgi:hypothetical protein